LYRRFIPCKACGFESCKIVLLNFPKRFAALFVYRMVIRVSTPHGTRNVINFPKFSD
jgi:hypothetical protein